jgi:hypothetical protein
MKGLNVERGGEKTCKSTMKLITRIFMKIHEINTPQKNERERERVRE